MTGTEMLFNFNLGASCLRQDRAIRLNKDLTGKACQIFIPLLSLARFGSVAESPLF
jgi:hypothetical protein